MYTYNIDDGVKIVGFCLFSENVRYIFIFVNLKLYLRDWLPLFLMMVFRVLVYVYFLKNKPI